MAATSRGLRDLGRGVALSLLAYPSLLLGLWSIGVIAACAVGVGLTLLPPTLWADRAAADLYRRLAHRWGGVPIPSPYLPHPPAAGLRRKLRGVAADPARWRDVLWLFAAAGPGSLLASLPALVAGYGVSGFVMAILAPHVRVGFGTVWFIEGPAEIALVLVESVLLIGIGVAAAPPTLRIYARFARSLLGPTAASALKLRVRQLTETRTEVVDAQAAEMRRIERDLHDGAQARLAALGMSVGLAAELVERDPAAARALLAEARESAGTALAELRSLVRGIHPPLLADRGLAGAVQALALDLAPALYVDVSTSLPDRLPAPVESAMYFAVAEALANAVRHAHATRVRVSLRQEHGEVVATISDDGRGGAAVGAGGGLAGVERRLRAFDGALTVDSPPGGPTTLIMIVPVLPHPATPPD